MKNSLLKFKMVLVRPSVYSPGKCKAELIGHSELVCLEPVIKI